MAYDALLLLSFGGPEGPDDVLPFLRNVTRGRGIPDERLALVASHYQHFGGVSPINSQNRALLAAIRADLAAHGVALPVYWGNRNWHPLLTDTVAELRDAGVQRALAFVTSAYGGYSGCRQYVEDIAAARAAVGDGAPVIDKLRHYGDHPGFVDPHTDAVRTALAGFGDRDPAQVRLVFTAHSVPTAAAGPAYPAEVAQAAALVAAAAAPGQGHDLVWQSRSGAPGTPWLAPDINDHLRTLPAQGVTAVVVSPIGFVSDHVEVIWDLDTEAAATAAAAGLAFARAATPGTDPRFVAMVRELATERTDGAPARRRGDLPWSRLDPPQCCPPRRPA